MRPRHGWELTLWRRRQPGAVTAQGRRTARIERRDAHGVADRCAATVSVVHPKRGTRSPSKTPRNPTLSRRNAPEAAAMGRLSTRKRTTWPSAALGRSNATGASTTPIPASVDREHRLWARNVEPARVLLQPQAETIMRVMSARVLAPASRSGNGSNREPRKPDHGFVRGVLAACIVLLVCVASRPAKAQDDDEWITPAPAEPVDRATDAARAADAADAADAAIAPAPDDADWDDASDDLGEEYSDQGAAPATDEYADTDPTALDDFRPYLDPHGQWVYDPVYGQIWVPNRAEVGKDFAPYVTNGYWGEDENGDWIWISGYDFGWVVFHYGRWVWVPDVGWAWIPGRRYAPAWVVWRVPSDDYAYIGWAPMPPSWGWHGGVAVSLWVYPPYPYVFCPTAYVYHRHVHTYVVHDHARVRYAARHTRRYHPRHHRPRPGHTAARPRRGPSASEAHVPASSRPKSRTPADPRAVQASRRSTASKLRKAGYRAKALPGSSAANRAKAIKRGGRPLAARNFESAPRPRVTAKGAVRPAPAARRGSRARPAAGTARSAPRSRTLRPGSSYSGGRKATPRSSSRYQTTKTPRRAPRAKRPTRSYRPKAAPAPSYRPKSRSSRSSRSYRPTRSYRPKASSSRSRSYRPSGSSSDYKKKKKSSSRSYTPRRSPSRSHFRGSRSSSPAPRRSAPVRRRR